jgi:hypothetical protein
MAKTATATADAISFVVFLLTILSVALYLLEEAGIFNLIDRFPWSQSAEPIVVVAKDVGEPGFRFHLRAEQAVWGDATLPDEGRREALRVEQADIGPSVRVALD